MKLVASSYDYKNEASANVKVNPAEDAFVLIYFLICIVSITTK